MLAKQIYLPAIPSRALSVTTKSQKTREDDISLLLVVVAKLLAVRTLLALAPGEHLRGANGDEEGDAPVSAGDDHAKPRDDLKHVVGAGHELEAVADGDLALGAASGSQASQVSVDGGVAQLAKEVDDEAEDVHGGDVGPGSEGARVVEAVGAEAARDDPVEEAVLEDVLDGHGVCRELVDEEGLVLALEEVKYDHVEREPLGRRHGTGVAVQVGAGENGSGVDEDGANVLDDEDGPPIHLRTCIVLLERVVWGC